MSDKGSRAYDNPGIDTRSFLELVRRDKTVDLATRIDVAKFLIQMFGDDFWQRVTCAYHIEGIPGQPPMGVHPNHMEQQEAEHEQQQ